MFLAGVVTPLFLCSFLFGWPGALLLQTALGQTPISFMLLADALYALAAFYIIDYIHTFASVFSMAMQNGLNLIKFEKAATPAEQEKIVEDITRSLYISPDFFAYQLNAYLTDNPVSYDGNLAVTEEFKKFCKNYTSLEEAVEKYAENTTMITILASLNAVAQAYLPGGELFRQIRLAELFQKQLNEHYCPLAFERCKPHFMTPIASLAEKINAQNELRSGQDEISVLNGKTPYEILGVNSSANDSDIKKAYYHESRKTHPDKNQGVDINGAFAKVAFAYDMLSDPNRRAKIDEALKSQRGRALKPK